MISLDRFANVQPNNNFIQLRMPCPRQGMQKTYMFKPRISRCIFIHATVNLFVHLQVFSINHRPNLDHALIGHRLELPVQHLHLVKKQEVRKTCMRKVRFRFESVRLLCRDSVEDYNRR